MKKSDYFLNYPAIILITLFCSTKIAAQSQYDIYVFDKKSGITRQVSSIPNASEFNASWSNSGKKIVHDVVGGPSSPYDQSIFITDVQSGVSTPLIGAEG